MFADGGCDRGNNDMCNVGQVCGRFNNNYNNYICCPCTDNDCVLDDQAWCRNDEGGYCSDGNNNNCAVGLVCGDNTFTKENTILNNYSCCEDFCYVDGVYYCTTGLTPKQYKWLCISNYYSQQFEEADPIISTSSWYSSVPNMLVGSSNNQIHQERNMLQLPILVILGCVGLVASVGTLKIAKYYHHRQQERYNQF